jgi:hypothetical protein
MISEWMKVMLEEISRKQAEEEQWRIEAQRRIDEQRLREEGLVVQSAKCTTHD